MNLAFSEPGGRCIRPRGRMRAPEFPLPLRAGDEPVTVRARRFGDEFLEVVRLPAGATAELRFGRDLAPLRGWVLEAPGACLVR